jgi:hypothetical protein
MPQMKAEKQRKADLQKIGGQIGGVIGKMN